MKNLSKFYFSVAREQMRGTAIVFFPGNGAGYLKHVIVSVEYILSNQACDLFVTFDIFRNLIEIMSGISEYFSPVEISQKCKGDAYPSTRGTAPIPSYFLLCVSALHSFALRNL